MFSYYAKVARCPIYTVLPLTSLSHPDVPDMSLEMHICPVFELVLTRQSNDKF